MFGRLQLWLRLLAVTLGDSVLIAALGVAGALLGALIGGYFAYRGALDAAKLGLLAAVDLAREAADRERVERTASVRRDAAMVLLDALNAVMVYLTQPDTAMWRDTSWRAELTAVFQRVNSPYAYVAGPGVIERWTNLEGSVRRLLYPDGDALRGRPRMTQPQVLTEAKALRADLLSLVDSSSAYEEKDKNETL